MKLLKALEGKINSRRKHKKGCFSSLGVVKRRFETVRSPSGVSELYARSYLRY